MLFTAMEIQHAGAAKSFDISRHILFMAFQSVRGFNGQRVFQRLSLTMTIESLNLSCPGGRSLQHVLDDRGDAL